MYAHLKEFGLTVLRHRQNLGLSQRALANKANLSKFFIGDIELGRRNPTLKSLLKLSGALGVSVSGLLESLSPPYE